ncbi:uncharacterized protein PHALS_09682 [Plasmopara halstedii]|uniref:Uncharacterized protein n=1 Tax=Plasmopara halstedii TaxID=4781 RepID=A0A0N7L4R8_PLAHL|nr:uncharacterized protein PHALS_09682 [Plasmopara halstedii]CEG39435.1 hypothetical protein PHALS_09682 [Plasmopara halstedii]|eukprot:XP_024575804.1 hypothetical protein PHALS_09682 [Plasmopara halstedii]
MVAVGMYLRQDFGSIVPPEGRESSHLVKFERLLLRKIETDCLELLVLNGTVSGLCCKEHA